MRRYIDKLFEVLAQAIEEDKSAPIEVVDVMALESQATYFRISHFVKPDMLVNVYGLVDFWIKEVCDHQMRKNNLSLKYKDVKGDDDLQGYHKYLTKYAGLNLDSVKSSYDRLQQLRIVRNHVIHNGSHVPDDEKLKKKISAIKGIALSGSLLVIDKDFVTDVLECAKKYLCTAAAS